MEDLFIGYSLTLFGVFLAFELHTITVEPYYWRELPLAFARGLSSNT